MLRTIAEENSMLGAYNWKISRGDESETILQGYVKPQYSRPGYTVSFHASSELDNCQFFLRIYRLGWYRGAGARQVHRSKILSVGNHGVWSKSKGWQQKEKCGDAVQGMDWPRVYQLYIPEDWLSGSYIAKFETLDGKSYIHPFWISTIGESSARIAVLGAVITSQSRNWWGGVSATQVVNGSAFTSEELYYPVGSEVLSFERPYFNSRGGDALRWEYPLVRWLEKNQLDVAYHTDLELETNPELLSRYSHIITAGPMRYWTNKTESALQNYVNCGGNIVHLGSEAGQHIVKLRNHNDYHDGQIVLQPNEDFSNLGERLENTFFSTTVSGSRKKMPWGELKFNSKINLINPDLRLQNVNIEGIAGLSWDKSIKKKGLKIVASKKIKHRKWTYRVANSHILNFQSGGSVFNAGVSSWTWALEEFGNHGNTEVSEDLQRITLGLLDLNPNMVVVELPNLLREEIEESGDLFSLEDFNVLLQKNPRNFDALIGAGIMLWEQEKFNEAHTYFERALQIKPESIIANYRIARNHHKLKQFEEMLPIYDFLLKQAPHKKHYFVQYADLLINLGQFDDAEKQISELQILEPKNPTFLAMKAQCARRKLRFRDAEKYCQKAMVIDPSNSRTYLQYALIAHDQRLYIEAEERWERLLKISPNNYSALMGITRGAFKRGDYEKGQSILEDMVKSHEHNHRLEPYIELMNLSFNHLLDYNYTISICESMMENIDLGIQEFKRLEHVVICHLTLSLSKIGKFSEAENIATHYMMENPENNEYNLCLSQISRNKGSNLDAFTHFISMYDNFSTELTPVSTKSKEHSISVENLFHPSNEFVDDGPLVSVIMTAYQATELIEIAINSILNQSYTNFELIVVDDASPDNTFQYIQKLAEKDSRIFPVRLEENGGTYVAKNQGLLRAKGKYVAFHDSDDWCHCDKLKLQVECLENSKNILAVSTSYIRVDENSNIIYRGKGAIRHACISLMFRREIVVERIGFFDSVRVSADSEYEMRIKAVFGDDVIQHIPLTLIVASVRSESLSQGGKFALSWSGISGPRLEYRQFFDDYHIKIRSGKEKGYVDFPLKKRVFKAPEEIIW